MNVLIINDSYKIGGANTVIKNHIEILKNCNIKFSKFSFGNKKIEKNDEYVFKEIKFPFIRYIYGVLIYPKAFVKLLKYIKKTNPQIIHLHNIDKYPFTILLACRLAKNKLNCKIVRTVHDYGIICPTIWCVKKSNLKVCEGGIGKKCFVNCLSFPSYLVYRIIFVKNKVQKKVVDAFIVHSNILKGYLIKHNFKNIVYFPMAVKQIKKLNLAKINNQILYAGELSKQKGVELLIKTMPLVQTKIHDINLKIAGDGTESKNLIKLVKKNNLESMVYFTGKIKQQQLFEEMSKSVVVIMPSIGLESFGLIGTESILCGTPVLATKRGGMTEWIEEGKNGFYLNSLNPKAIAKDILLFFNNPISKKMMVESRNTILNKFNIVEYKKNIMNIYSETKNKR